jgi:hypothetical protein
MGYTTEFRGRLKFSRQLTEVESAVMHELAETRHGGNIAEDPAFPGYYCQWIVTGDRKYLEWDGGEKFYNYIEWLNHIIDRHLEPWGVTVTGTIRWQGEERNDKGRIRADNSVLTITRGPQKRKKQA